MEIENRRLQEIAAPRTFPCSCTAALSKPGGCDRSDMQSLFELLECKLDYCICPTVMTNVDYNVNC